MTAAVKRYRLHLPHDLTPEDVRAAVRSLTSLHGGQPRSFGYRRSICFEAQLSINGVVYWVSTDDPSTRDQLLANLPGAVAVPAAEPSSSEVGHAVELKLTRNDRPLRTDEPGALITAILAGLIDDDWLRWQLVLTPLSHRDRSASRGQPTPAGPRRSDRLLPTASISASGLRAKQSEPPFVACLRLGVRADDATTARRRLGRAIGALQVVAAPGVTPLRRTVPMAVSARRMNERAPATVTWPALLSADELSVLLLWPLDGVATPWPRGPARRLLAPPAGLPRTGRRFGGSAISGLMRPIVAPLGSIVHHTHVVGPTGTGKSTLLAQLALQDISAGRATIVIDPKGDLTSAILDRIGAEIDVAIIDLADRARPVGLNLLQPPAGVDPEMAVELLLTQLKQLYRASWGPRTQDIIHAGLSTLAAQRDTTLVALPRLLSDPSYRRRLVAAVDDPLGVAGFWSWYEALSPAEQAHVVGPVMNKLRTVLLRPSLRNVLGQRQSTIDMADMLAPGRVLLVELAGDRLGADAAQLLGALLVGRLWQLIKLRRHRSIVSVYLDEFQDLLALPSDLGAVLATARSRGVGLTLAHQHLAQLTPALKAAVLANARSRVVFQTSSDAKTLAGAMGSRLTADDLRNLPAFEAYAQLFAAGRVQAPLSVATDPMQDSVGSGRQLRQRSRARYGSAREEVEAEIRDAAGRDPDGPIGRIRRQS